MLEKEFLPRAESLELRDIGFDVPCFGWYLLAEGSAKQMLIPERCPKQGIGLCLAPTFSQAFRWFRDKYNIDAWVQPFVMQTYLPDESYCYFIFKDGEYVCDKVDFLEPEDAELACLKKLIEIVKNK